MIPYNELTAVKDRLDRLESENRAMARQIAENGQLLRALEERSTVDGAALVAKMAGAGELDWLNATRPESAKKAKR